GGPQRGLLEHCVGDDGDLRGSALPQDDADLGDVRDLLQLLGDRRDAVPAGHALDLQDGGAVDGRGVVAHECLLVGGGRSRLRRGRVGQDRTSRAIASLASRTFSAPSSFEERAASTTQWPRWSSTSPSPTAWSARVTAEIWVRTSMQYT